METDRFFNPGRLELARKRRGLTKVSLAKQAAIPRVRLQRIVAIAVEPSDDEITTFSEVLRFPAEFFFLSDVPELGNATFRSLSTMTAAERDAAEGIAGIAWELTRWIDQRYHLPEPDIPDLSMYEPAAAAMALRNYWGLGERPVGNMVRLLEAKGARVFSLSENTRRVDAFSVWVGECPFVFLNTIKTTERSRTDAAHELGHLTMRHHTGGQRGRNVEKDAQQFAGVFLVPDKSVLANVGRLLTPTISTLVAKKKIWKVSVSLLAHRLHAMNLLSDYYYRGICIKLNRNGRSWEPERIDRETSQILTNVFNDLHEAGLTKADVAASLKVQTDEIDSLTFGIGGMLTAKGGGNRKYDPDAAERRSKMKSI